MRKLVYFAVGLLSILLTGCPLSQPDDAITNLINQLKTKVVTIRVANSTGYDVQLIAQIDSEDVDLPICDADAGLCDFLIEYCPSSITILEEIWYNSNGIFSGGRDYANNPNFDFEPGEFNCGAYIILQLGTQSSRASVVD